MCNQQCPAGAHEVIGKVDQTALEEVLQVCSPCRSPISDFSPEAQFRHCGKRHHHAAVGQMAGVSRAPNTVVLQDKGDHVCIDDSDFGVRARKAHPSSSFSLSSKRTKSKW